MRRLDTFAVAAALALLASQRQVNVLPADIRLDTLQKARELATQYGHRASYNKGPAELDRLATKRRRARQTHPGKRGKA